VIRPQVVLIAVLIAAGVSPALAQNRPSNIQDLSLEDLLKVEVTSVARKEQPVGKTAAPIFVITAEEIRRSGATTLPDLLRFIPGFFVGQLNANTWSIASRGFASIYGNKLLVLIDGMSLYDPTSGGVSWELHYVPLDMIARIEVVRGPGGSLWGANAINGVINIITKAADATTGLAVSTRLDSMHPGTLDFSYGSRAGSAYQNTRLRFFQRESANQLNGRDSDTSASIFASTRWDWGLGTRSQMTFSGHLQRTSLTEGETLPVIAPPYSEHTFLETRYSSAHAMFSWTTTPSSHVTNDIQAYYRGSFTNTSIYDSRWHAIDVDARQRRVIGSRHDLVAGGQVRVIDSAVKNGDILSLTPSATTEALVTAFVQDEIALPYQVRFTPGVKLEHNARSGVEWLPSVRALWAPTSRQSVWASISRAVRTPNLYDQGVHFVKAVFPTEGPLPAALTYIGNPDFRSEVMRALEGGYRSQVGDVSIDVALFKSDYSRLSGLLVGAPEVGIELGAPVVRLPLTLDNGAGAVASGGELSAVWRMREWWRVVGAYSYSHVTFSGTPSETTGAVPEHQWQVRTSINPARRIDLDAAFYRVSPIATADIKAYSRLDLRLKWHLSPAFDLAAGVQNLLREARPEFVDVTTAIEPSLVRPRAYVEAAWRIR
jgi:iron complex outermembrane receptor protein